MFRIEKDNEGKIGERKKGIGDERFWLRKMKRKEKKVERIKI